MQAFSRFIAAPSVSCINPLFNQSNREVVEMLANWFADLGFATELQLVSSDPDKLNLIACIGQGAGQDRTFCYKKRAIDRELL